MLTLAGMGGMDEMGLFYDRCLESLYPPGMCGTFCNQHTYDCFLTDIRAACCDEDGLNCPDGQDVPITCPVGCAIVYPEFIETCRAHIHEQAALQEADYEEFEELCLSLDVRARLSLSPEIWCAFGQVSWSRVQGLALVEYAMQLQVQGCVLDLSGVSLPSPLASLSPVSFSPCLLSVAASPGGREAAARAATRVR